MKEAGKHASKKNTETQTQRVPAEHEAIKVPGLTDFLALCSSHTLPGHFVTAETPVCYLRYLKINCINAWIT